MDSFLRNNEVRDQMFTSSRGGFRGGRGRLIRRSSSNSRSRSRSPRRGNESNVNANTKIVFKEKKEDKILIEDPNVYIDFSERSDNSVCSYEKSRLTKGQEYFDLVKCFNCSKVTTQNQFLKCCGYLICNTCSNNIFESGNEKQCLNCKKEGRVKLDQVNKLHERLFNQLNFNCQFSNCENNILKLNEVDTHERTCKYNTNSKFMCPECFNYFSEELKDKHKCIEYLKSKCHVLKKKYDLFTKANDQEISYNYLKEDKKEISDFVHSTK